jgi:hypothetical protein
VYNKINKIKVIPTATLEAIMTAQQNLRTDPAPNNTGGRRPSRKEALQQVVSWLEREHRQVSTYPTPAYHDTRSRERLDELKLAIRGLLRQGRARHG